MDSTCKRVYGLEGKKAVGIRGRRAHVPMSNSGAQEAEGVQRGSMTLT